MKDALLGCIWALLVTMPAALAGFAVLVFAKRRGISMSVAALVAGIIRILIAAGGSVIIMWFDAVAILWFMAGLAFFYSVTLIAEVYFAISAVSEQKNKG